MKTKKMLLIPGLCLLLLQAIPIDRKLPQTDVKVALEAQYNPPDQIMGLLKNACYDCHSNHTRYPWYTYIQPVGWWIQRHITKGREELNFSEIGRWKAEDQADLLRHSAKMLHKEVMPLGSYLKMHPEARLSPEQKAQLVDWLLEQADKLNSPGAVFISDQRTKTSRDSCDDSNENTRCCFVQMPESVGPELALAPVDEPGQRILIQGQFFKKDGKTPYPNVLVYAYQTDSSGRYTKNGDETGILRWHGRLHGWGRTDAAGRYSIRSIRPGLYPSRSTPAHIHAVVWKPGVGQEPYYIRDFLFAGDPYLSPKEKQEPGLKLHQSAVVVLRATKNGVLEGRRDIVLK